MMPAQRVILVTSSRLLGDMLHRVICRSGDLEVVQEFSSDGQAPHTLERAEVEWIVLALNSDKTFPGWVSPYLASHPSIKCLVICLGSSKVKLKWQEYEEELGDLSLKDVINLLEGHAQRV